ncbi:MAG TPA: exodeoxyribonuclease III [Gammaproteobacteria bacterium]|nr:exodeoxyribonuclease III [Gammaproteobacteria bacterium]
MKIATWNVNSLKIRLPQVLQWLESARPDVLALQEIKQVNEDFPLAEIQAAGYTAVCSGQKTYNGVAILSRKPLQDTATDIDGLDDPQRRILAATVGDVRVLNLYVVNGQEVDSEKYHYKLKWLQHVSAYIKAQLQRYPRMVILGDFNIAPDDRDVHDPEAWREKILCSTKERAALQNILAHGFSDTFRRFEQEDASFSWWDYRAAAFRRNLGLRIDLVLASHPLAESCRAAGIDKEPRKWERPSDHVPVWAEFNV